MIGALVPGQLIPAEGSITLNEGREVLQVTVRNTGDRPIQVGSHYHFAEANPALDFDREATWAHRLDVPAGSAVRFEPGQTREVALVPYRGTMTICGFRGQTDRGASDAI